MQINQSDDVIDSTAFLIKINMINKDISVNLYYKCLNFCSKILLVVLRNMSLTISVTIATY